MDRAVDNKTADRVSHETRVWCARQVIRMHTYGMDGPTGRCKTCPGEGDDGGCANLAEAKAVLNVTLVGEQA